MDEFDKLDLLLEGKDLPDSDQATEQEHDTDADTEDNQSAEADGGDQSSGAEGDAATEGEGDSEETDQDKDQDTQASSDARKKQEAAFAKLRVENSKLSKAVQTLTKALNVEGATLDEQLAALQDLATKRLAKEQGIPAEILQKLNVLEEESLAVRAERTEAVIVESINALQQSKNLSDEKLAQFVAHLDNSGLSAKMFADPTSVDLGYVYHQLYGQDDIEHQIQSAVEKALKEHAAAGSSASVPNKQQGKQTTTANVNSIQDLDALLNTLEKK